MNVVNHTPFTHLVIERRDTDDRRLGVLMLQGTFAVRSGAPLRAVPEQEPVHVGDRYRGDPRSTGLVRATATATFKPSTDVHVDAVARSPGGQPRSEWPVRIVVGSLQRDLLVRGPHWWTHGAMLGWRQSAPEPCREVPLHHELAFGGSIRTEDGVLVEEPRNLVGTGFLPRGTPTREAVAAPRVVAVDEPPHEPGRRYVPRGCAPIPPHFAPRSDRLGTCDDVWRRTKWPCVPADFDYAYFQSAHPDFVYDGYLRGDEPVQLIHLGPRGSAILTALPGFEPWALFRLAGGRLTPSRLNLDTLVLAVSDEDPALHRAYLTWRCVFPLTAPIQTIEARMRGGAPPARAVIHG